MNLQKSFDVLDKVELLVAGAGPEIVAHDDAGLALLASLFVDEGDTAFAAKRRIGEHHIEVFAWVPTQAVGHANRTLATFVTTDAVQEEVHDTETGGVVNDLPTVQGVVFQEAFLIAIQVGVAHNVVMGGEQE